MHYELLRTMHYELLRTMNNYDDIINLPHHVSSKHPQMPMQSRAAQFAPFAAVKGDDDDNTTPEHPQATTDYADDYDL